MVSPAIEMVNILLKQYSVVTGANNAQALHVVHEQYNDSSVTNDVGQVIYIDLYLTVPGQPSPRFHIKACLPFRNREKD